MSYKEYPYFNYLLTQFADKNSSLETSFGRHVHWGYWQDPSVTSVSNEDYAEAAENLTRKICEIADIRDDQVILDAGCGFGGTIAHINEHYHGVNLTGVNIDKRQLERAEKQVQAGPGNNITFIEADACAFVHNDIQFDRILAVECIFHFPSRERFFEQSHHLLKAGGSLTLSDFIPTTYFLPVAWMLSTPAIQKYSLFGRCNISYSLNKYRVIADKYGFKFTASDITSHTLPTYEYLKSILRASKYDVKLTHMALATIHLTKFISNHGFLKYQVLNFKKL